MKQKYGKLLNLALFACCVISLVVYDMLGGLWRKGLTSGFFLLMGLLNLHFAREAGLRDMRYPRLIVLGLFFGACADVLLGVRFYLGVASFALGHICYLLGFYSLEKPGWRDWKFILPIGVLSLYLVAGTPFIRVEDPVMKPLLLGYAGIIAAMLGKAAANLTAEKSVSRRLTLLGSAMFWVSDLVLAVDMFGESSRLTWIFCSYVYWPAQCVQAYALYHYIREKLPKEA